MIKVRSEDAIARFEDFFTQHKYRHLITSTADQYPKERSIYVDYKEIENHDMDLAEYILKNWHDAEIHANTVIKRIVPPELESVQLNFRVRNIPSRFNISKLRTSEQGQLIGVEGLVRRVTEVKQRIVVGVYQCHRCGGIIKEPQDTWHPREPLECYKEQNGCGRTCASTRFKLSLDLSEYVDSQKIEIQEPPESTTPGAQPQRIVCYAEIDIVGLVNPGDRIIVNGVRTPRQRTFPMKSTILDTYMDINSIETQQRIYDEIEITGVDEENIIALSQDPRCYQKIVQSIIPTVYGMSVEKEAIALQLFGGVAKDMPDGTRLRGDIHILLVGDPGTAKSTIMRAVAKIAPRGIWASGKSTSGPGLIAAVVKDPGDFGEGRWTVEAGAMALADRGQLCVDELDKMRPEDRDNMHEAMAQQEVFISKADIHSMVHTRCPVLAAANPKEGRFDSKDPLVGQIKMPPTLLSRFDLIFSIMDVPDTEHDNLVARHILEGVRVGQYTAYASTVGGDEHSEDKNLTTVYEPTIEPERLRKYLAYAKRNVAPVMDQEVIQRIQEYYVDMRKGSGGVDTVAITPRQLQAVVRLSEASARMYLSNTIDIDRDVDRAIRIMQYYLKRLASEDGAFDIDMIEIGTSHSQRERIKTIKSIIAEIAAVKEPVLHEHILLDAERNGITRGKAEAIITKLMVEEGYIYETEKGSKEYRLARR